MSETKIQWHPGFVAAMNLELAANRNDLVYEKEHNLNTRPLEIDLLVIKKDKGVHISNEIGAIFRGYNLFEYKSPEDSLDIDVFYKTAAYACLYKAYGETVDGRRADDITVSLVREARPDGLFAYFREHGTRLENRYRGIYYVQDSVLFPTQIIVSGELDSRAHLWLKALSGKMGKQEMRELIEKTGTMRQKFDRELADSVLEVSVRANQGVVDELKGDEHMCQALLEIMEPEINKIKEDTITVTREAVTKEVTEAVTKEVTEAVTKEVTETVTKEVTEAVTKEVTETVKEMEISHAVRSFRDFGANDQQIKIALIKNHQLSPMEADQYLKAE